MKLFAVIHLWDLDGSSHPEAEVMGLYKNEAEAHAAVNEVSGLKWNVVIGELTSDDESERWQVQEVSL